MIIIPFHRNGNKSLFVVMGAKHIKDYMKTYFGKTLMHPLYLTICYNYAGSLSCMPSGSHTFLCLAQCTVANNAL